jgi:rhodanese-related sulfurtransferase
VALRARLEGDEDFVLLDVRSEEEFREGSLSDRRVVNIPLDMLRDRRNELPRNGEIIIFCRTSVRAYEAQRTLEGFGFRDVKFLDGSLKAWPYPL